MGQPHETVAGTGKANEEEVPVIAYVVVRGATRQPLDYGGRHGPRPLVAPGAEEGTDLRLCPLLRGFIRQRWAVWMLLLEDVNHVQQPVLDLLLSRGLARHVFGCSSRALAVRGDRSSGITLLGATKRAWVVPPHDVAAFSVQPETSLVQRETEQSGMLSIQVACAAQ